MQLRDGAQSSDLFFLAMAHWRLGYEAAAHECYGQAIECMKENEHPPEERPQAFAVRHLLWSRVQKDDQADQERAWFEGVTKASFVIEGAYSGKELQRLCEDVAALLELKHSNQ